MKMKAGRAKKHLAILPTSDSLALSPAPKLEIFHHSLSDSAGYAIDISERELAKTKKDIGAS